MSQMGERIIEIREDLAALVRTFQLRESPTCRARISAYLEGALEDSQTWVAEGREAEADLFLIRWWLGAALRREEWAEERDQVLREAFPWIRDATRLLDLKRDFCFFPARDAAESLNQLSVRVEESAPPTDPLLRQSGTAFVKKLRPALEEWRQFFRPYDPEFAWWTDQPFAKLLSTLDHLEKELTQDDGTIPGAPIGDEALREALRIEMIPYSPSELLRAAEAELEWCDAELLLAAKEVGFETIDEAFEHVKSEAVEPGMQTTLVVDLAREAEQLVEDWDLLTVPQIASETWRMKMLSSEAQTVSPFFLGGETVYVSYPTDDMSHERKLMSMRGNNPAFSRATVQHELIPGHHMQQFFSRRYKPHRALFETPFWVEGWTLHWEMLWWERGFARTPEDRIGMLFWRRHRAARVIFSTLFHQGRMSTQECVDYLVERVGHERSTAEGEVRRSFGGDYPPLYQLAYLVGGWQVHQLHREMTELGWTDREFHDRFLRENKMPIPVLRAILLDQPFDGEALANWRFLDV